jgi:hypothetical protein
MRPRQSSDEAGRSDSLFALRGYWPAFAEPIEPDQIARVMSVEPAGEDAIAIVYKTEDGRLFPLPHKDGDLCEPETPPLDVTLHAPMDERGTVGQCCAFQQGSSTLRL